MPDSDEVTSSRENSDTQTVNQTIYSEKWAPLLRFWKMTVQSPRPNDLEVFSDAFIDFSLALDEKEQDSFNELLKSHVALSLMKGFPGDPPQIPPEVDDWFISLATKWGITAEEIEKTVFEKPNGVKDTELRAKIKTKNKESKKKRKEEKERYTSQWAASLRLLQDSENPDFTLFDW